MAKNDTILTLGLLGIGAYAIYTLKKPLEQTGGGIAAAAQGLGTGVQGIGSGVSEAFGGVGQGLSETGQAVGVITTEIGETFESVADVPQNIAGSLNDFITAGRTQSGMILEATELALGNFLKSRGLRPETDLNAAEVISRLNSMGTLNYKNVTNEPTNISVSPTIPKPTNSGSSLRSKDNTALLNEISAAAEAGRLLSVKKDDNKVTAVVTPTRDSSGLSAWDKRIAENKRIRDLRS